MKGRMKKLTSCSSCRIGWTSKRFLALSSPFAPGTYWMPCTFFVRNAFGLVSWCYRQRNGDLDSGFVWHVVLKRLCTCVSDFIWIDHFMHRAFWSGFVANWLMTHVVIRTNTFQRKTRVTTIHQLLTEIFKVSAAEYAIFLFMKLLFTANF